MKWIGQHIWDFIARFRSDVYLEDISTGTIESGGNLGLDANNKIVKANVSGGGSGSALTIVDMASDGSTTSIDTDTTTITIVGDDIQALSNGSNNVMISSPPIVFASDFSISTDPVDSLSNYFIPHDASSTGHQFYVGDWGGERSKPACKSGTTLSFASNLAGNMEGSSKIVITVYGADTTSGTGSGNILGEDGSNGYTHLHTVDPSGSTLTSSGNGITVTLTNWGNDGLVTKKKANVTVVLDPSSTDLITGPSTYLTGSQKYHSIKIEHKSSDLSTTYGTFTSESFFYDNKAMQPTASVPTLTFGSASTKQLSNIGYYKTGTYTVTSANHQNVWRDTTYAQVGSNNMKALLSPGTNNVTAAGHSTITYTDANGASGTSNDLTMTKNISRDVSSSKFALNLNQHFKTKVYGGLGGDSAYSADGKETSDKYVLDFDGTSTSYVDLTKDIISWGAGVDHILTTSFWIKFDELGLTGNNQFGIGKHTSSGSPNQFLFGVYQDKWHVGWLNADGWTSVSSTADAGNEGEWQHAAVTLIYNSATVTTARIYINGQLLQEFTMGKPPLDMDDSSDLPWVIGGEWDGGPSMSDNVHGDMTDIALWNKSLSGAEIKAIYNNGLMGFDLTSDSGDYAGSSDLQAFYKTEEGSGTSLADSSGNSHTGTLQANVDWVTTPGNGRNFHSYTSSSTKMLEDNKGEDYRVSHGSVSSYIGLSTAQTDSEATWKTRCVGSSPTSTSPGLPKDDEHLVQGYFSNDWRVIHPNYVGSVSTLPTPTELSNSSGVFWQGPGDGSYEYIRFFGPFTSSVNVGSISIEGLTKSLFETHAVNASNLEVHVAIPGNSSGEGVWIPLNTEFAQGTPTSGCWANRTDQTSSSVNFDVAFAGSFKVALLKIKFNESFQTSGIGQIQWYTTYQNA